MILLGTVVLIGFFFLTPYRPPPAQYFSSIILTVALLYIAKRMPENCGRKGAQELKRPVFYFIIGVFWSAAFFLTFMALPYFVEDPFTVALLGALLSFGIATYLMMFDWKNSDLHKLSLAAGIGQKQTRQYNWHVSGCYLCHNWVGVAEKEGKKAISRKKRCLNQSFHILHR